MHGEMPGFFPGRPGGEHDEPLLDMILERRPTPPGAPPEIHALALMLAAVAGPAEPGELAGEYAALAAFTRLASSVGTSPAAPRSGRRLLPGWSARGRLPLAAALTAVAAGLGSTAAAYANVLPGPIQHFAHVTIGAPDPPHYSSLHAPAVASPPARPRHHLGTPGPWPTHAVAASASASPRSEANARPWHYGRPRYGPGPVPSCLATPSPTRGPGRPSPSPSQLHPSPTQNPGRPSVTPTPAAPGPSFPGWPMSSPAATAAACPASPAQDAVRPG